MAQVDSGSDSTNNETAVRYLVTVGMPVGMMLDPETKDKIGMLRHGRELLSFDLDVYRVLLFAQGPMTHADIVEWATSHQHIVNAPAVIARCLEVGLLREIDFEPHPSPQWAELRLQTAGVGMGADLNDQCEIDIPGRTNAYVDRFTYMLWVASDGRSIQNVVDALVEDVGLSRLVLAAVAAKPEIRELGDWGGAVRTDPAFAKRMLAVLVPPAVLALLSTGAAFLDQTP